MNRYLPLFILTLLLPSTAVYAAPPGYELVEEIDCSQPATDADLFREYPAGMSKTAPILERGARSLPNDVDGLKYFGYRLGRGKGLQAGQGYVVEIDYPQDVPRSMFIINMGAEVTRGFHTGNTLGDAMKPRYVNNLPESLELPLSGKWEKWQMLFHLHDRFPDIIRPRDKEAKRTQTPADGFWVFIAQFEPAQDPLSKGAAVSKIRLYKAPALEAYAQPLKRPPAGLPQRHVFVREEMADGVVGKEDRGLEADAWFEYKARTFRLLGIDTYGKDLLEFGANQGWDSAKFGDNKWVYQSHDPKRWERIVDIATKHGLNIMPYYEYSGSKGEQGYGNKLQAQPLGEKDKYTHIAWTETARADLTQEECSEDFRKMLEVTIGDLKDRGKFIGAWLRPRSSQLPISFGPLALASFSKDTAMDPPVTREQLRNDAALYAKYKEWWFGKRYEFLTRAAEYVRQASGNPEAVLLYTADVAEAGKPHPDPKKNGLVAEDPARWEAAGLKATSLAEAIREHRQLEAMTLPTSTWGGWEWNHAVPEQDPARYAAQGLVLPTFTINRAYTVADASAFDAFRTKAGLAVVRHFSLNENMFREGDEKKPKDLFGYFVSDMELAGPFCMLAEVRAVANGDPRFIGYLTSSSFNTGFPEYVRNFNAAFLALPALPSERLAGASPDPEVAVRRIDAGKDGVFYAIANTGYGAKENLTLKLPDGGRLVNAATGEALPKSTVNLYPCQLLALHVAKAP